MRLSAVAAALIPLTLMLVGTFGLSAPVTPPAGWFVLAAIATVPPLIFLQRYRRPVQALPARIQETVR